jgi:hypothetical protein
MMKQAEGNTSFLLRKLCIVNFMPLDSAKPIPRLSNPQKQAQPGSFCWLEWSGLSKLAHPIRQIWARFM